MQNIFLHISGKRHPMGPHQSRSKTKCSLFRGPWAEELEENLIPTLMTQQVMHSLNQNAKQCKQFQLPINHKCQTTNRQWKSVSGGYSLLQH